MSRRYSFAKRNVTPKDIPDQDCPHSHFDTCVFKGDFSAYDWRDCDFTDCDLTGVTALPDGEKLDYICSRRSTWSGVLVPDSLATHNHDLLAAWLRSKPFTGADAQVRDKLATFTESDYRVSFPQAYKYLGDELSKTSVQVRDAVAKVFAGAPRLLKVLDQKLAESPTATLPGVQDLTAIRVMYAPRDARTVDVSGDLILTKDRWELARHLESVHPDLRFWIAQIEPSPIILASHRRVDLEPDYEDWWWTAMWVV